AVVHTAQIAKIRHFEIRLDAQIVERVRADGIIVATPTGSTSYSMSAGGPIVDPHLAAIIVTAIAPLKPASRPHVFPAPARDRGRSAASSVLSSSPTASPPASPSWPPSTPIRADCTSRPLRPQLGATGPAGSIASWHIRTNKIRGPRGRARDGGRPSGSFR